MVDLAVTPLSTFVGMAGENLHEVVYKVVNRTFAPMFAFFVSRATTFGTIEGGVFGFSFIWTMRVALLAGGVFGPEGSAPSSR